MEQIDQSVERILQLKIDRGIIDHTGSEPLQKNQIRLENGRQQQTHEIRKENGKG